MNTLILGNFIDPTSDTQCQLHRQKLLHIEDGKVRGLFPLEKKDEFDLSKIEFLDYSNHLIIPPFFDMHFHWVQDDVRMMPKDNLLTWLEKYTWPYEHKFSDVDYSKKRAISFSKELLAVGTLGGACYSSIHSHTVDHALEHFQGDFIVGNVLMTMNSPDYLLQKESDAIEIVKDLSTKYREKYALTPRFAITTSPEVMSATADIVANTNSFIQTHLSETENEIDFVLSIYKELDGFKDVKNYTEIYDRCAHLGNKTIMGHGIYLSEDELRVVAKSDTVIAHCPTSNGPISEGGLGSGLFDFEKTESFGIRWALGSDIGAGPYLSMFDVIRSFVEQNRAQGQDKATFIKGLFRATRMGESILHPECKASFLEQENTASMLFISASDELLKLDSAEEILEKVITTCSRDSFDTLVDKVWHQSAFL